MGEHVGETVTACGLVVEQRTHHQITGEPMKFLTLADWTGIVETELFAQTYKNYGLATVRYPVLEVTATVEPFENGRGFSLRVLRAGKPRAEHLSEKAVHADLLAGHCVTGIRATAETRTISCGDGSGHDPRDRNA
jgi:DNA polymerase III alpha subunit